MISGTNGIVKVVLSVLLFPMLFQDAFIRFAWGAEDTTWVMIGKRLFLLLPAFGIIVGCWISIACLLSVIIRQNRRDFIVTLFITWWDLGKSIVSFWGGIFRFALKFVAALVALFKISVLGLWSIVQEILFLPFRLIQMISRNVVSSSVPWIAVFLTLFWCAIEATIFTYVTTPLVVDTFSNITGEHLPMLSIRIPLFVFLLFIVLGSYAVLSTLVTSAKKKNFGQILGIGAIEAVVLFVEVVFLYREFVDSLVPWFAQYSENFELGMIWTLVISCFVWFGIRSVSWFLFASHGTPTIMAVIQGRGIKIAPQGDVPKTRVLEISTRFINKIKSETEWIHEKGEELLASLMLPPLQVVAAAVNFCTLLVTTIHLFQLPFKNLDAITNSKVLIDTLSKRSERFRDAQSYTE